MVKSTILGFPRIGRKRELKFALESFWKGERDEAALRATAAALRADHWGKQRAAGIDLIPSGDFSYYDHVLDMSALLGVVPQRYGWKGGKVDFETYFAMARGVQKNGRDVHAAEMTKWFDTNYHYIVPVFEKDQTFQISDSAPFDLLAEATEAGIDARPVLLGPLSYLWLGKMREGGDPLDLFDRLVPVYAELLSRLEAAGASWVQLDEPLLVCDIDDKIRACYQATYEALRRRSQIKIFVTTPFGGIYENNDLAFSLPIDALHLDLVRAPDQLDAVLEKAPKDLILSLGLVSGRNIWRTNLEQALRVAEIAVSRHGADKIWISPSCSLLHVPYDLSVEGGLDPELASWMAFAEEKLREVVLITRGVNEGRAAIAEDLALSVQASESRRTARRLHEPAVRERLVEQPLASAGRAAPYPVRCEKQQAKLHLPLYPTTTIGSFPQTAEVRQKRAAYRKGTLSAEAYEEFVREEIKKAVAFQEEIDLDVLVHGEFERNDMVEYFAEKLAGFAFTEHGWVQSYGSRCVKPPIIYGDVIRTEPMTVELAVYAQSLTRKPMKGMLTGPVTILQWAFVRDDQPRSVTAHQIALALQDEVLELESAGLQIIQIDEPAFREGLPLRRADWSAYFAWAVQAFRLSSTGVREDTQIHTHMCYSSFNEIIDAIRKLDADVISIETSRSAMELLDAFVQTNYPNGIGPGVYDIHSPRVPPVEEMVDLLEKASRLLAPAQIWVNPDCGLKTRDWPETKAALKLMVDAAKTMRARV